MGTRSVRTVSTVLLTAALGCAALAAVLGAPHLARAQEAPAPTPSGDTLRLLGAVPVPGDALRDEIVLFFDKPLAGDAAQRPPALEPAAPGTWTQGDHYLRFESDAFEDGEIYRVSVAGARLGADGERIADDAEAVGFARLVFEPAGVFMRPDVGEHGGIGITFPAPVDVESLREHLTLRGESGAELAFTLDSGEDGRVVTARLESPLPEAFQAEFAAGVKDATGLLATVEPVTLRYPPEQALSVRSVEWRDFGGETHGLQLRFSGPVTPEDLQQYLTVQVAEGDETAGFGWGDDEPSASPRVMLYIPEDYATELTVRLESGLASTDGAVLTEPFTTKVSREAGPLRLRNYWFTYDDDRPALQMNFTEPVEREALEQYLHVDPPLENRELRLEDARRFLLFGDWNSEQTYTLRLNEGLPYAERFTLQQAIVMPVQTPEIQPHLDFGYDGQFYFPRRANVPLALTSRNLDAANLTLYRMFPENVALAVEELGNGEASWQFAGRWTEELAQTEVTLPVRPDRVTSLPLDLEALFLTNQRGVFLLVAEGMRNGERQYPTARKVVVWTDMGLLAHWQDDALVVFAHDLYSLAPLADATVTVHSRKNQVLATGATGAGGIAHLTGFNPALGEPSVVVVEKGGDYALLELEPRSEDPVGFASSMPRYEPERYDAFVYADRELYRPGETAHLQWLVRGGASGMLADAPVKLRVRKPNGRILAEQAVMLNGLGSAGYALETQDNYPTGRYRAEVLVPGSDAPIGSYEFHVEDFVPNRIKAEVALDAAQLVSGESVPVRLTAEHLFGAPASGRKAELSVVLQEKGFDSERWPVYRFTNDSEFQPDTQALGEAQTGEDGTAAFTFEYAPEDLTNPVKAYVVGRVFELGGRGVTARIERPFLPSETLLGLAVESLPSGSAVKANVAAIRPDESPADLASVTVTLEKQVWNYYVRRYHGHNAAHWSESFEPVETREVALTDGAGAAEFDVAGYGYYRVRVHSDATPQFATQSFYCYGDACHIVDEARPSLVTLTLDQDHYTPGDTARLRVESPFDGKGFVVLQGADFQQLTTVSIENGAGVVELPITERQFPNAWAEVTVVHGLKKEARQVYPFSSFAMVNVPVENPARELDVAFVNLPEEVPPESSAEFTVRVTDGTGAPVAGEFTLAAVDEGIHLVTGYDSPEPYAWLSRDRRPDFRRAHYYDRVAYDFEKPSAGGGLDALLASRTTPPGENWVKPLALWSGTVRTGEDGTGAVTFDLPAFNGRLRLDAVAASRQALGSATAEVFVRRPYMLRVSHPRFLLPGDRYTSRATVFNTTDAPVRVTLSCAAEGAVAGGAQSQALDVPASSEAAFAARLTAGDASGQGKVVWTATVTDPASGDVLLELRDEAPLPVRPPAAYQSASELVVVAPGEERTFEQAFSPTDDAELSVVASANPLVNLAGPLAYVVGYPYGCLEQTVSRLFPLYLLRQNEALLSIAAGAAEDAALDPGELRMYLQAGIYRILALQTPDGGIASWPGAAEPYPYGSIYALHFLTLARGDAELDVPAGAFEALQRYVRDIALDGTRDEPADRYRRAYAVYALALDGDLAALQQIPRFDTVPLPRAARYLLAAALAMNSGDTARVEWLLSQAPMDDRAIRQTGGALLTPLRNTAVELLALVEAGGDAGKMATRAGLLQRGLGMDYRATTQEAAFVIAALSRYLDHVRQDVANASGAVAGPEGEETLTGDAVVQLTHTGPDGAFTVRNTGEAPIHVHVTRRGVPTQPRTEPVSEGLRVARRLFTSGGEAIDDAAAHAFRAPDSYVVELTLSSNGLQNVALTDLLPAGFEIENPRLDASALPGVEFESTLTPSHLEVRDDRLVLAFDDLPGGSQRFHYVIRAVTPGTFTQPALQAECMYDPAVRAATVARELQVTE